MLRFLSHPACAPFAKPHYAGSMIAPLKQRKNKSKSCGCDFFQPPHSWHITYSLHILFCFILQFSGMWQSWIFMALLTHTRPKQEWEEEKNERTAALEQEFQNGLTQGCFLPFCSSVSPPCACSDFSLVLAGEHEARQTCSSDAALAQKKATSEAAQRMQQTLDSHKQALQVFVERFLFKPPYFLLLSCKSKQCNLCFFRGWRRAKTRS